VSWLPSRNSLRYGEHWLDFLLSLCYDLVAIETTLFGDDDIIDKPDGETGGDAGT
jgi:hypothetical protein